MTKSSTKTKKMLDKAVELHVKGDLSKAEIIYHQVINEEASCFAALANLGSIYFEKSQWQEATLFLKSAVRVRPTNAELQYKLAVSFHQQNQLEEAISGYRQAIRLQPNYPEAYSNLGVALKRQGKSEEAIVCYQQAISQQPNFPDALSNLGAALKDMGKIEESIPYFQQAIALNPDFSGAHYNLGLALKDLNKLEEAIIAFQKSIALRPDYAEVYNSLGAVFYHQNRFQEAIAEYKQAILLNPSYVEAYSNLGAVLRDSANPKEAISMYQQAISIDSAVPAVHYNLGLVLYENGQLSEAIKFYQQAIILQPNYPDAHLSLAIAFLHIGEYTLGWKEYEWRFQAKPSAYTVPNNVRWDGSPTNCNELVLIEEQGIGDIVQFSRYGNLFKDLFQSVSIAVRKSLVPLIEATNIYDKVYAWPMDGAISEERKWLPLMSTAGLLGVSLNTPLVTQPYLQIDTNQVKQWHQKIHSSSSIVIGLNWQGNPKIEKNEFKGRSFRLSEYEPLASIPGVKFASLQKGYGSEQLDRCSFQDRFVECQNEINETWDLLETAAILQSCDLIITSDTSIAHLAGALGKPTWILLKKIPDWRWGLEGESTSWYPSARLFRQTEAGNWTHVIENVKDELAKVANKGLEVIR
jgi:tetratricopeptide (TPR) repeat protein